MVGFLKVLRVWLAAAALVFWPAMALASPPVVTPVNETRAISVAGTTWQGEEHFDDGRVWKARYEFRADGTILETYWGPDSGTCEGRWEQDGDHISFWTYGNVLNRLEVDIRAGVMKGSLHGPVSVAAVKAWLAVPLTS